MIIYNQIPNNSLNSYELNIYELNNYELNNNTLTNTPPKSPHSKRRSHMPLYSIDPTIKQPAYLQLYRQIRQDITSGLCPYGSKLPSKRFLAAETGTSVITVQHAYDLLSDEGYIRSQERSGYYVCYKEGEIFPVASSELSHLGGDLSISGGFSGAAEETQNDKTSNSPAVKVIVIPIIIV